MEVGHADAPLRGDGLERPLGSALPPALFLVRDSGILLLERSAIEEWHLELSSRCALACPRCARTMKRGAFEVTDIDVGLVERLLRETPVKKVILCGNHGDPIYHPQFHDVLAALRKHAPLPPRVVIHTNGSFRDRTWWAETAQLLTKQDQLVFSIDGLEDTNSIYRVNSNFRTITDGIAECRGRVRLVWKFILFRHNEHQIEEAKRLAMELGFDEFALVKSDRFGGRFAKGGDDPMQPTVPFDVALARVKRA